jgi:hypothetical protein
MVARALHRIRKSKKYIYKNITAYNYGNWTSFSFPASKTAYRENQNKQELELLISTIPLKKTSFLLLLIGFIADSFIIIAFLFVSCWFWLLSIVQKTLKLLRK